MFRNKTKDEIKNNLMEEIYTFILQIIFINIFINVKKLFYFVKKNAKIFIKEMMRNFL